MIKIPASLTTKLAGWLHQGNVTIFLLALSIIIICSILISWVMPNYPVFALIFLGLFLLAAIGVVVAGVIFLMRNDSTESMSLRHGERGPELEATSPSIKLVLQFVQLLAHISPPPYGIIPDSVDPKDNPEKFKKLSADEQKNLSQKELEETFERLTERRQPSLPSEVPQPVGEETAQLKPLK